MADYGVPPKPPYVINVVNVINVISHRYQAYLLSTTGGSPPGSHLV